MTKRGNRISGVTVEQAREQRAEETDPKAIRRLTVAREYLDGPSPGILKQSTVGTNRRSTAG